MINKRSQKFFIVSLVCHVCILFVLILGFDFATPIAVIENTNKNDVINAVVLGDTAKSKILPRLSAKPIETKQNVSKPLPTLPPKPVAQIKKTEPKLPEIKPEIKPDAIALKPIEKKKLPEKKLENKSEELFAKDLLADIKKQTEKQKRIKQTQLKSQFEKTLREQSEQSLRQQLLNEEIKLSNTESREAQGEINKYKALIVQTISEHWIVPISADKKLSCELMIRLAPSGMVLEVSVAKSSGDPSLDSSARAAVLKSSPLPVPPDAEAFKAFRQFILKVKPENILSNNSIGTL